MLCKKCAMLPAVLTVCLLAACGNHAASETQTAVSESAEVPETAEETAVSEETETAGSTGAAEPVTEDAAEETAISMGSVPDTLAEDEDALIAAYAGSFEQLTYSDTESGLSVAYNLFLPEGYDGTASWPLVVFIADSSCTGGDAAASLTQGLGALVWASDDWQAAYPSIVAVPTYPETILDDHGSYTTTEYVELTKRFIDFLSSEYAVDTDRIYGTGQSMGCMTTLILASEYPDLYAACMFVDGQWDVSTLSGLEDQTFVYFAAEDDANAWNGAQEVMAMLDADSVSYAYAQWDGTWSADALSAAAQELFSAEEDRYFISWASGTVEASDSGGGSGSMQGPGGFGGPGGGMSGGAGSSSVHMASFDYAYSCTAVMEWLFAQTK